MMKRGKGQRKKGERDEKEGERGKGKGKMLNYFQALSTDFK
jgi:hypothetical protein